MIDPVFWRVFLTYFRSTWCRMALACCCLLPFTAWGQQNKIDSLFRLLKTDRADTTRMAHLNELCWEFANIGNTEKGLSYGQEALKLYDSLSHPQGKKWNLSLSAAYNNIGFVYSMIGDYEKSLDNYLQSSRIEEKLGDKMGVARTDCNIGNLYFDQLDYNKASHYLLKALTVFEEAGDKNLVATCLFGIGNVYYSQNKYDSAISKYSGAMQYFQKLGNTSGVAYCYENIGLISFSQKKFPEALTNLLSAQQLTDKNGSKNQMATLEINLSQVYMALQKKEEAMAHARIALDLAKETGSKRLLSGAYELMASCDSVQNNWKSAYENYKVFKQYNDSMFNSESVKKLSEVNARFEGEKKEAKIKLLEKDREKQAALSTAEESKHRIVVISFIIGLLLMVAFSVFMYNRWILTRRQKLIIEDQRSLVQEQKEEVEKQKMIVEEKNKEVMDSIAYAKRLQQAILPPDNLIRQVLPDSFVLYRPKAVVAGDFYWMFAHGDTVLIAAADCTGHGVPGAMVSIVCSNALKRAVNEFGLTATDRILGKTTELVLETFADGSEDIKDGMDISLLSVNKRTHKLQWSGANNPLWIIRNGELIELKGDKQPVGKSENPKPFTAHDLELNKNDCLYLITDGFADQFGGARGKKFKYKQLKEVLLKGNALPLTEQKVLLETAFEDWMGNLEQVDDICVIGISV
jgi:serine phosphatase RsbU (regulator of sigma subunit)